MRLGNILDTTGLTKSNVMKAVKLGLGAAGFPLLYSWLRGMAVSRGYLAQGTAQEYVVRGFSGLLAASLTVKYTGQREAADGMMAAAIGSIVSDVITPMLNPAAKAAQAAAKAEELQGVPSFSASNPMGVGLAGLGYGAQGDQSLLFGVGTPDTSAARMLSGATVAIEQPGLAGATVAIEQPSSFAGTLF